MNELRVYYESTTKNLQNNVQILRTKPYLLIIGIQLNKSNIDFTRVKHSS